ncbi:hypothetical protein EYF80_008232 [Liparis tanakae]|uniref:Uncharacterized protein n=1 Tax=Liparis tanakae TaxID=230148 RepID=A0A4Z2ITZ7_9TELE|nr:hypothetical protein EYF80_008232 [Liparis tanakae]
MKLWSGFVIKSRTDPVQLQSRKSTTVHNRKPDEAEAPLQPSRRSGIHHEGHRVEKKISTSAKSEADRNVEQIHCGQRDYNQHDIQCKRNYNSHSAVQVGRGCCTAERDEADEPAGSWCEGDNMRRINTFKHRISLLSDS